MPKNVERDTGDKGITLAQLAKRLGKESVAYGVVVRVQNQFGDHLLVPDKALKLIAGGDFFGQKKIDQLFQILCASHGQPPSRSRNEQGENYDDVIKKNQRKRGKRKKH